MAVSSTFVYLFNPNDFAQMDPDFQGRQRLRILCSITVFIS